MVLFGRRTAQGSDAVRHHIGAAGAAVYARLVQGMISMCSTHRCSAPTSDRRLPERVGCFARVEGLTGNLAYAVLAAGGFLHSFAHHSYAGVPTRRVTRPRFKLIRELK
jgi:hypothetical protein